MLARVIVLLGLAAVTAYFSMFRVYQWEQAIIFQFREVKGTDNKPGLHFKIPIINSVMKMENRLLNLDKEAQRFLTFEKKDVLVDYFIKWRIADLKQFYTSTGGDINTANNLLEQRINSALRDQFGGRTVQQVISGERTEILNIVTQTTSNMEVELGIKVLDVRTKRIDLPERSEERRVGKECRL